jgi:hypothetical protein
LFRCADLDGVDGLVNYEAPFLQRFLNVNLQLRIGAALARSGCKRHPVA